MVNQKALFFISLALIVSNMGFMFFVYELHKQNYDLYSNTHSNIVLTIENYNLQTKKIIDSVNSMNTSTITTINEHNSYTGSNILFYPRKFRECRNPKVEFYTNGQSMFPLFNHLDKFYVEPVRFDQVELGDVIMWENENGLTVHAVNYISEKYLLTAGYNNFYSDETKVTASMVKYRHCVVI